MCWLVKVNVLQGPEMGAGEGRHDTTSITVASFCWDHLKE